MKKSRACDETGFGSLSQRGFGPGITFFVILFWDFFWADGTGVLFLWDGNRASLVISACVIDTFAWEELRGFGINLIVYIWD
jgi:hypothetical protein